MKCLETDKLVGYAYRLLDDAAAAQVRVHVRECDRCREIVEQHLRLDAVLNEWTVPEPTPAFDVRVRQAVEAQGARRTAGSWWGWRWSRGLALASFAVLIVAGLVGFNHRHRQLSSSPRGVARQPQPAREAQAPPLAAKAHPPAVPARGSQSLARAMPESPAKGVVLMEDKDAQTLEDYDLAANFDVLSELPKGEPRVVN